MIDSVKIKLLNFETNQSPKKIQFSNLACSNSEQCSSNSGITLLWNPHLHSHQLPRRRRALATPPRRRRRFEPQRLLHLTRRRRSQRPVQRRRRRRSIPIPPLRLRYESQRLRPRTPARPDEDLVGRLPELRFGEIRSRVAERSSGKILNGVHRHGGALIVPLCGHWSVSQISLKSEVGILVCFLCLGVREKVFSWVWPFVSVC